jgi:hypothetical protein
MSENEIPPVPEPRPLERNQVTWAMHRREVLRQITIPLVLTLLVVIACGVLVTVMGTNENVSQWADVSLIWLIMPQIFVSLIVLIILAAMVYGLYRLLKVLPFYTKIVQDYFILFRDQVAVLGDTLVEPFLAVKSKNASWRSLKRNLFGK